MICSTTAMTRWSMSPTWALSSTAGRLECNPLAQPDSAVVPLAAGWRLRHRRATAPGTGLYVPSTSFADGYMITSSTRPGMSAMRQPVHESGLGAEQKVTVSPTNGARAVSD
jgi:hypothetical protein